MKATFNWLKQFPRLALFVLLAFASFRSHAADKLTVTINKQIISAYRTADLESAKKEAAAAHKPIAWIATSPTVLGWPWNHHPHESTRSHVARLLCPARQSHPRL